MTGIWGTAVANDTTRGADVVLAVGTAFGEADCSSWDPRFTFAIPPSRLIQIDIEPQEIGKIYPVEVGLVGDAQATLRELIRHLRALRAVPERASRASPRLAKERAAWEAQLKDSQQDDGTPIHPARLLHEISKAAPDDAIFVTDVGWNKNGAGQQLQVSRPGSFITSGGMATMGFAPGAAIGAKIGAPDRKVICLVGDGGLLSAVGALATAVELGVPVLWVRLQQFLLLDDPHGRHDVLQQQLRHGVHHSRRPALQSRLPAPRQGVRDRERAGRSTRTISDRPSRKRSPSMRRTCSKCRRVATSRCRAPAIGTSRSFSGSGTTRPSPPSIAPDVSPAAARRD